jgi:hypothetical protein
MVLSNFGSVSSIRMFTIVFIIVSVYSVAIVYLGGMLFGMFTYCDHLFYLTKILKVTVPRNRFCQNFQPPKSLLIRNFVLQSAGGKSTLYVCFSKVIYACIGVCQGVEIEC